MAGSQDFEVLTYHKPLKGCEDINWSKVDNPRVSNLLEKLSQFHYRVSFCPGKLNIAADCLSRIPKRFGQDLKQVEEEPVYRATAREEDNELMREIMEDEENIEVEVRQTLSNKDNPRDNPIISDMIKALNEDSSYKKLRGS